MIPYDYYINKYNIFEDKHAKEKGWLGYLVKAFEGETVHIPDMEYDPQQSGNLGRKRILQATAFPIIINEKVENGQSITIGLKDINNNKLNNFTTAIKSDNSLLNSWMDKLPEKITSNQASLEKKTEDPTIVIKTSSILLKCSILM